MPKFKTTSSIRFLLVLLIIGLASGCSFFKADQIEEMPAEDLAKRGLEQYRHGKYFLAVETFNTIKERFPFSRFSLLAELKSADCKFNMEYYSEALELYREFEDKHPSNEAIPYVLFQIGRSHYRTINTIDRDTTGAHEAIKAFARLLRTFPDTPYTEEAKALTRKSYNFLADHELYVANFYFRTKRFEQARQRAQYLVANYPQTTAVAEAQELLGRIDGAKEDAARPKLFGWFSGAKVY